MTSSRSEYPGSQDGNNDEDLEEAPYELKLLRDRQKPPPAEADGFMLPQEAAPSEELRAWAARSEVAFEHQPKRTGIFRRTPSGSGVAAVTADLCGESDLTADHEHHVQEESSSNYHGHEMLESGVESASAISSLNNQFRPPMVSGKQPYTLGPANGGSVIRPSPAVAAVHETGLASLTSNFPLPSRKTQSIIDCGMTAMIESGNSIVHTEEPAPTAPRNPLGSCSTAQQSSVTSSSSESAHGRDWLQLCVGPSENGAPKLNRPDADVDCEADFLISSGRKNNFGDGNHRPPTSIPASAHTSRHTYTGNLFSDRLNVESAKPIHWQNDVQYNSISSSHSCSVPQTSINSQILQILPVSTATQNGVGCYGTNPMFRPETANNQFSNTHPSISTGAAGPAVMFLSRTSSGMTARLCTDELQPAEPMIRLGSEESSPLLAIGGASELRRSFMLLDGGRKALSGVGQFGSQNRDEPAEFSALKPVVPVDGQCRAAPGMDLPSERRSVDVRLQRDDSQRNSLSDWVQATGKFSHNVDARQAWLLGSGHQTFAAAVESSGQQLFIPLSNAFKEGSAKMSMDVSKFGDVAFPPNEPYHGDNNNVRSSLVFSTHQQQQQQQEQQTVMSSDDWERLRRKVSPSMVFQSRGHQFHEGPSSTAALHHLVRYSSNNIELTSTNSDDQVSALKVAFESIQGNPQLQSSEALNLINCKPVTGWSFGGGSGEHPLVRVDSGPESFTSLEREAFLSKRVQFQHSAHQSDLVDQNNNSSSTQRQSWQQLQPPVPGHKKHLQQGYWSALQGMPSAPALVPAKRQMLLRQTGRTKDAQRAGLWFILRSGETQDEETGLPQISKAYLRIKDGKMPVSAVKKYLVSKLGLSNEAEVEITCKGQPVVPSLPLQHVRDAIWFSNRSGADSHHDQNGTLPVSDDASPPQLDRSDTESHQQHKPHLHENGENGDGCSLVPTTTATTAIVSKDILMVLTYRRHHPPALQLSNFLT